MNSPSSTIAPGLRLSPRLRRLAGAKWRQIAASFQGLGLFLADELHAHPGRVRDAVRSAMIVAVGSGLMAAMAIDGPMGPYILQGLAGGPVAMTPASAATLSLAQLLATASSVSIIGVLIEAPWLLLGFFIIVGVVLTYAMMRGPFTAGKWLYIEVSFLNSFFLVVFDPRNFGWAVAYTFAGGIVAFAVAMAFDNWLWPISAEQALLESLSRNLAHSRERWRLAVDHYLDPALAIPHSTAFSSMPAPIEMLARAVSQGIDSQRHAVLVAAVTLNERLAIEVERLLVISHEAEAPHERLAMTAELRALNDALAAAMDEIADHLATGLRSANPSRQTLVVLADQAAQAAQAAAQRLVASTGFSLELSNLSAYLLTMTRIARVLRAPPEAASVTQFGIAKASAKAELVWDREAMVHAVKVSLAMTIGYLIVLFSQHGDLDTVALTVMITALPSYGATLRKMNLRLGGAALGAVLALVAMIAVTPNFESVGAYMLTFFVALAPCAYIGLSSPRLAYLGKQATVTFVLAYLGLSPSIDIYRPLYRIWGVFIGIVIVAGVFLLLIPDYSAKSMIARIERLLRASLDLLPSNGAASRLGIAQLERADLEIGKLAMEMLSIADDARLEGPRSGIFANQAVHASGTLRRIARRASELTKWHLAHPQSTPVLLELLGAFEIVLRARLQYWLDYFDSVGEERGRLRFPKPAPPPPLELEQRYQDLAAYLAGPGMAEIDQWPLLAKTALFAQLESWNRLAVLAGELDEELMLFPRPMAGLPGSTLQKRI